MPTRQQILNDVNLRYRNTFTTDQKNVWANEEELELFEVFEIDAPPYAFTTVAGEELYPIPQEVDIDKIKVVTYQMTDSALPPPPVFREVRFKRNDDNEFVGQADLWYTIISDAFYFNIPGGSLDDRVIYIYHDKDPQEWNTSNLSSSPDTPTRYQEILKLGILKRICAARKDAQMQSNYDAEYEQKINELMWRMKMSEPEFITPVDFMPSSPRLYRGTNWGRWPTTSP
ncbi:hypothetical protein [Paenibacillus qinlingensis]|uniref:Uncharacterized protein n=1 Tax=Paenibacillus qinlingensis TaxID=1837343 RepID=A0ABU1P6P8_9BACL|nr:hypothetical protein [Paenibacillus qinlingensis]MDR6555432.1 hypothetical protein [Paenibacillus qinlingensis]